MTIPQPPTNPPDLYAGEPTIECPGCHAEVPAEVNFVCPCGEVIDSDAIRDEEQAASEPPEWG